MQHVQIAPGSFHSVAASNPESHSLAQAATVHGSTSVPDLSSYFAADGIFTVSPHGSPHVSGDIRNSLDDVPSETSPDRTIAVEFDNDATRRSALAIDMAKEIKRGRIYKTMSEVDVRARASAWPRYQHGNLEDRPTATRPASHTADIRVESELPRPSSCDALVRALDTFHAPLRPARTQAKIQVTPHRPADASTTIQAFCLRRA